MIRSTKLLHALLVALLLALVPARAEAQSEDVRSQPWPDEVRELAESLPTQDGGRVKPLHTHASFLLLRLNGKRSLTTPAGERLDSIAWILDVLFFPRVAADYEIFLVQNQEVIEAIGVEVGDKKRRDRYSLNQLMPGIDRLFELASEYAHIDQKVRTHVQQQVYLLATNVREYLDISGHMEFARRTIPVGDVPELENLFGGRSSVRTSDVLANLNPLLTLREEMMRNGRNQAEISAVSEIMIVASEYVARTETLALIPPLPGGADADAWQTPSDVFFETAQRGSIDDETLSIVAGFETLADQKRDPTAFAAELRDLHSVLTGRATTRGEYGSVELELAYYKSKILDYSQYGFVLAFLLMSFLWLRPKSRLLYAGTSVTVLGATLLLCGAITVRCLIRQRPPVSTLYETVLFVTGVAALLGLAIEVMNRRRIALSAAAVFGVIGLFIANGYEMIDKRDTMPSLVAVLDTNFWLATHVTAITIGYSAGMLAALLASVYILAKAVGWRRSDKQFLPSLAKMVYGVLCFALIFSTVGTILGGIWANDSWGRFWGWDPKENGALLIVLSQLLILHGRMGGFLRQHGLCMATAFGGTVIAFSWWGVNLLGVGLHSYGFTSGISAALWTYYYIQWGIVAIGALVWLRERARTRSAAA